MLVECGFTRVATGDGSEWSFTPSLGRIASLGSPHEIVRIFAALHGPKAEAEAAYVLAGLCDQDDPSSLIGARLLSRAQSPTWVRLVGVLPFRWLRRRLPLAKWVDGRVPPLMPPGEQVVIARHLMLHGIVGKAKPDQQGSGKYADRFDAAEYVSAARVHLGLSGAEAEAMSMTEFQMMLEAKFPDQKKATDLPTADEYEAARKFYKERRRVRESR